MVGHAFPLFAHFRGGKAVMTFVGGAFATAPLAALAALAACGAATAATRSFKLGARVGVFGYPLAQLALYPVEEVAATGALMCIIGALFVLRTPEGPAKSGASRVAGTGTEI